MGYSIALEPVGPTKWRMWFHSLDLGLIDIEPEVSDAMYLRVSTNTPNNEAA